MIDTKSNQTVAIWVGFLSLFVGLLLGWYFGRGTVPLASAQQQIPRNVNPRMVAETQCGTYSHVQVGVLPHPISEGRTPMVNDFIADYTFTNVEDVVGRDAVIQGMKIRLTLSRVDPRGNGSVKSIEVRDRETGQVLATKQLSNAERRQNVVDLTLTFRTPLIISAGTPPGAGFVIPPGMKVVQLYADTAPIKTGISSGNVTLFANFINYKSANIWQTPFRDAPVAAVVVTY